MGRLFVDLIVDFTNLVRKLLQQKWTPTVFIDQSILLSSMACLCEHFTSIFPVEFDNLSTLLTETLVHHARAVVDNGKYKPDTDRHTLIGVCLKALARICRSLKLDQMNNTLSLVNSYFPKTTNLVLMTLQHSTHGKMDGLSASVVALQRDCMQAVAIILPKLKDLLSPYLDNLLRICSHNECLGSEEPALQEATRASFLVLCSFEFRVIERPLCETLLESSYDEFDHGALLSIFDKSITASGLTVKVTADKFTRSILPKFVMPYLDKLTRPHMAPIGLCDRLNSMLLGLLLRLRESEFQVTFECCQNWCFNTTDDEDEDASMAPLEVKQAFFFRMCSAFASKLKDIFIPYFVQAARHAVDSMRSYDPSVSPVAFTFVHNFLCANAAIELKPHTWTSLVPAILNLLPYVTTTFEAGNEGVDYSLFERALFKLCDLAGSTVWLDVMKQLMLELHQTAQVKLTVLNVTKVLFFKLGEEFATTVLPEFLPHIFELLESDDDEVSQLATEIRQIIEKVIGENLEKLAQ
eukprot:NODE_519_length_2372_cov_90.008448_g493_i0.p1 GENE.NODE_519_length_2372_cov_90.008448_g493_i0~~NODE_519_length_2372_cov_90.008448_g493_i0.p1  ORF type:complete len:524 (+),score=82.12 NODE_519_length_2372_cov_90.008448_g493_i0:594-2165(+)